MHIDRPLLNRRVDSFLRSPEGRPVLGEMRPSLVSQLIWTTFLLMLVPFLCVTCFGIYYALKILWHVLSGETFRDESGGASRDPDQQYPLIGFGIIVGPTGRGLVLGTFDEQVERDTKFLASKARELGRLYAEGASHPRDANMAGVLQDDQFQRNRRRPVMDPTAEGRALYLFDMRLTKEQLHQGPAGSVLVACVATRGDRGAIVQIPWQVVDEAVKV